MLLQAVCLVQAMVWLSSFCLKEYEGGRRREGEMRDGRSLMESAQHTTHNSKVVVSLSTFNTIFDFAVCLTL